MNFRTTLQSLERLADWLIGDDNTSTNPAIGSIDSARHGRLDIESTAFVPVGSLHVAHMLASDRFERLAMAAATNGDPLDERGTVS